ncbi:hypothetical protein BpHYR1_021347 [Brachionus plicatilis]|uniref:Uncharacterized protein n=1 Tax=Brachionus plicatilis TaxID=10195 RepID=A0A3M7QA05_BRAPC|nr:hypothetical protein BpHYR1_021347 [Brachionus plicatilis]
MVTQAWARISEDKFSYKSGDSESFLNEKEDSLGNSEELTCSKIFDVVSDRHKDTAKDEDTEHVEEIKQKKYSVSKHSSMTKIHLNPDVFLNWLFMFPRYFPIRLDYSHSLKNNINF